MFEYKSNIENQEKRFKRKTQPLQAKTQNNTGLPDRLKNGVESLSGMDLSDVRVSRNSSRPAQMNALAYAQGNEIHLGPGQEKHLPHEAWHIAQQKQGRVQASTQMKGTLINNDDKLEKEADVMGNRAMNTTVAAGDTHRDNFAQNVSNNTVQRYSASPVVQRVGPVTVAVVTTVGTLAALGAYIYNQLTAAEVIRDEEYTQVIKHIKDVANEIIAEADKARNAGDSGVETTGSMAKILAQGALLERNSRMEDTREKIPWIARKLSEFMKAKGKTYEELFEHYKAKSASENPTDEEVHIAMIAAASRSNPNLFEKFRKKIRAILKLD